jgi:GSH-dependent disulfide-bond oxidoreductase
MWQKTDKFLPNGFRDYVVVMEWLFWQTAGLGPMAGQNHHFSQYAPEKIPCAIDRYVNETNRLYGVLDARLSQHEFIAGNDFVADRAVSPWIVPYARTETRGLRASQALVRGDAAATCGHTRLCAGE